MLKVINYMVLNAERIDDLIEKVQFAMDVGWQPFGGVTVTSPLYYCQALVKYEEVDHGSKI